MLRVVFDEGDRQSDARRSEPDAQRVVDVLGRHDHGVDNLLWTQLYGGERMERKSGARGLWRAGCENSEVGSGAIEATRRAEEIDDFRFRAAATMEPEFPYEQYDAVVGFGRTSRSAW